MRAGFDHDKSSACAERKARLLLACPNRSVFVLEIVAAEFVEQQKILAFAIMRAADQGDVALPGGDPRQCDPRRVDTGDFLAHEGTRGSRHAVDDGDVAGEQV